MGAVALKNSVYVLPNHDESLEDFQWLRSTIVGQGGEATVCAASFVDGIDDPTIQALFRARSDADFTGIVAAAQLAEPNEGDYVRLERLLREASARDFFGSTYARAAERAVRELSESANSAHPSVARGETRIEVPAGATWVTRTGVRVDRIASAWLIRRFIDPSATLKFVPPAGHVPEPGELRFDMFDGEFTHEGEDCTFEVLVTRFAMEDPALRAIADVVHDIDCKDAKFGRPETAGIASLVAGIAAVHDVDADRVQAGAVVFDSLYAAFQRPGP
jgi:hypothetical protein